MIRSYETLTEALIGLRQRGYTVDFNVAFDKIVCSKNEILLNPSEFEITEVYRFEGDSDPGDENVVYAIESKSSRTGDPRGKDKIKGVLTAAYGTYAESISNAMIQKLSMHK